MHDSLPDRLITWLTQYPVPHHALSKLMHALTRARFKPWKNWQLRWFIRRYGVRMDEAVVSDSTAYPDFNSFFTRALKPEARPVVNEPGAIACPADGAVSQLGSIVDGTIFQAKKWRYSLADLLGGSEQRAAPFRDGHFATIYLSPRDYHRFHMPLTGQLVEMVHVPGRLFSVSPRTVSNVPRLFARNERVVTLFDTDLGPMAVVLVGAIFVASIETVWAGVVTPTPSRNVQVWDYRFVHPASPPVILSRGAELGRFNMGSTVIVLLANRDVRWESTLQPGHTVQMGKRLGHIPMGRDTNSS